jgi:multidrug efflux system membrane fusion protein
MDDGLRVIRKGMGAEDWVVLRGQQRVKPGQKIIPKRAPLNVSDATRGDDAPATKP